MNYHFTKVMTWFSYTLYLIANSTGANPIHVRKLFNEWQEWARYLEIVEIARRYAK